MHQQICRALLCALVPLVGACETFPVGEFCATDSTAPFDVRVTIEEGVDAILVTLSDPVTPLDSSCEVQLTSDNSRLVGSCSDDVAHCEACGLSIDFVNSSTIYIDYQTTDGGLSALATICRD